MRRDHVDLLVYGPDRPYFKQKQKYYKILANWLFLIYSLLFEKNKKYNKLI